MNPSNRLSSALLLALLLGGTALAEGQKPYYRWMPLGSKAAATATGGGSAGSGGAGATTPVVTPVDPSGGTKAPTEPVVPEPPAVQSLAFASMSAIPSGRTSAARSGRYQASGGKAPYAMSLANAPATLSLARSAPDGSSYDLTGNLGPDAASFSSASVILTDASGQSVAYPVPFSVTQAPIPDPMVLGAPDLPGSFQAGVTQRVIAQVFNGSAPYTWTIDGAPATIAFTATTGLGNEGDVRATVDAPGTYAGATITVTDATGATMSHTYPTFTVTQGGAPSPLVVSNLESPPATLAPGQSYRSPALTVSGGSNAGYSVVLEGAPASFYVQDVDGTATRFRVVMGPTADDVNRYDGMVLTVTDLGSNAQKTVRYGSTTVPAPAPLSAVNQPSPEYVNGPEGYVTFDLQFQGGSGTYTYEVHGIPSDFYGFAYSAGTPGTITVILLGPAPGRYPDIKVSALDSKTGQRLDFDRFAVTVPLLAAGAELSNCTGMSESPVLSLNVGDTFHDGAGILFSGGVAPYALTYGGSIPGAIGFAIDPGQVSTTPGGLNGLDLTINPTGTGEMRGVPVTMTDAVGGTCTFTVSASIHPFGSPR